MREYEVEKKKNRARTINNHKLGRQKITIGIDLKRITGKVDWKERRRKRVSQAKKSKRTNLT